MLSITRSMSWQRFVNIHNYILDFSNIYILNKEKPYINYLIKEGLPYLIINLSIKERSLIYIYNYMYSYFKQLSIHSDLKPYSYLFRKTVTT